MATQIYVSGPAYVWVGLGPSNAWLFLGYTESGLQVTLSQSTEDINVDFAGTMPADVSILGEDLRTSGTYTRYDDSVLQKILSFKGPNGIPGFGGAGSIGSLMVAEGLSYPLLLYSPYSFKNIYTGSMVPGWNIAAAIYDDANRRTLSVRRTAPECSFRALPIYGTTDNSVFIPNAAPFNAYQLYNNTMPNPLPSAS